MKIRIERAMPGYKKGQLLNIGDVLDLDSMSFAERGFYKNRIKDAEQDNCVSIYQEKPVIEEKKIELSTKKGLKNENTDK